MGMTHLMDALYSGRITLNEVPQPASGGESVRKLPGSQGKPDEKYLKHGELKGEGE